MKEGHMKIQEKDLPIVKAFLEREAGDYSSTTVEVFANHVLTQIVEGLAGYIDRANYLIITSYNNVGLVSRSLILTPHPWGTNGNVTIDLCTCGNPECWGTILFPNKTKIGKKGMTLLSSPIEDEGDEE